MKKYKQITTELTFRCNAKCAACHRFKPLRINLNDKKYTITVDNFKKLFYPEFLNNLEWLVINGNFGDSIMNKDFRNILSYVKEHDTKINIHTNGSLHNKDYWLDIGNILTSEDIINFDLDGLSDTHAIYRQNTKFENVFNNARTVISTGRPKVNWKFIVFEHNEHQIEEARELAKINNFTNFSIIKTPRQTFAPLKSKFTHDKLQKNLDNVEKKIHCIWNKLNKWYVSPDGLVFRCCYTGSHYYDEDNSNFYFMKDYEKNFNAFNVPIEKIISYDYWKKLDNFLQGYERSFSLCKSRCGKIGSVNEKIQESLKS